MPKVVPPKGIPEYHSDQSQHEHLPSVPLRAVIAGPSGCGKTRLIGTMRTDLYRKKDGNSVFKRIYVFSPSVHADPAWHPVKKLYRIISKCRRRSSGPGTTTTPGRSRV